MIKLVAFIIALNLPPHEIHCLAKAVWHEARGEPVIGQMAVAHVVMNRVQSPQYPETVCGVVYQPYQFTDIKKASPNRDDKAWLYAVETAVFAYAGYTDDPTDGATHYYAHAKVHPYWADVKETTAVIGGHTFKVSYE